MIERFTILCVILLSEISCSNQRKVVDDNPNLPTCSGTYNMRLPEVEKRTYQAISTIVIHSIIKESDTIYVQD